MEARQCGNCGSTAGMKMPGSMVSREAIQYSPVYCSFSDHSLSEMPQDRSAGRAITKCWLKLCLFADQHHMSDCFDNKPKSSPKKEMLERILEQAHNTDLKIKTSSEVHTEHRGYMSAWKRTIQNKGCVILVGHVSLPCLQVYSTAQPQRNPVSWHLHGLTGPM